MGRRAPTSTGFDNEEAESFEDAEQLRDTATPEDELIGKQIAATVNRAMDALPEDLRTAITLREIEGLELRGNCQRDELSDRHGALADLPGARGDRRGVAAAARHRREPEMVMNENISRLMDGELDDAEVERVFARAEAADGAMATWVCYHVIGDALRGAARPTPGFAARFAARARGRADGARAAAPRQTRPAAVRLGGRRPRSRRSPSSAGPRCRMLDPPPTAIAKAREAAVGARGAGAPAARVAADYLLAHQEYSPTTAIQGVGPVPARRVGRRRRCAAVDRRDRRAIADELRSFAAAPRVAALRRRALARRWRCSPSPARLAPRTPPPWLDARRARRRARSTTSARSSTSTAAASRRRASST